MKTLGCYIRTRIQNIPSPIRLSLESYTFRRLRNPSITICKTAFCNFPRRCGSIPDQTLRSLKFWHFWQSETNPNIKRVVLYELTLPPCWKCRRLHEPIFLSPGKKQDANRGKKNGFPISANPFFFPRLGRPWDPFFFPRWGLEFMKSLVLPMEPTLAHCWKAAPFFLSPPRMWFS